MGSVATYPVHLVAEELPQWRSDRALSRREPAETVAVLIRRAPRLSRRQYRLLAKASGRAWAPAYVRDRDPRVGGVLGAVVELGGAPRFGMKPEILWGLAEEWGAWDDAGRPTGGRDEARFCLTFYLHPSLRAEDGPSWEYCLGYAGLFLLRHGGASAIESILGIREGQVRAYWKEHEPDRPFLEGTQLPWSLWIKGHGGLEAVLDERFGAADDGQ